MVNKTKQIDFDFIIDIVLKRRWYLIIPFCLAMIVGIYLAVTLPKMYEASTRIMVQPQEVPKDYVRSVVTTNIATRINSITQLLKSRTTLEQLITRYKLFSEPEYDKMYLEDKVKMLSKNISIKLGRTTVKEGSGLFTVSFKGSDPAKVLNIANILAEYVIDENLKVRESYALGTTKFLDEELDSIRQKLIEQESALNQYRQKHMGELPNQLDSNLKILQRLQEQLNLSKENLRNINDNIVALKNSLYDNAMPEKEGSYKNISQMRKKLMDLKLKYTDQHPDVIRLKKMIEQVSSSDEDGVEKHGADLRISELEKEKTIIQKEIDKLTAKIAGYQKRIENTPKRELELISLQRDYDNVRKTYNSMLSRKLESEISVNLERKQKGEQLYIVDYARLPKKPISPDMRRIFLFSIAAGLGIGGGIIYLLEFMNNSFRSLEDIQSYLGLPVLASFPTVLHPKDIFIKRVNNITSILFLVFAAALLAGFSFITFKGL